MRIHVQRVCTRQLPALAEADVEPGSRVSDEASCCTVTPEEDLRNDSFNEARGQNLADTGDHSLAADPDPPLR